MGKLTKLFDRAADILVPKEIAGILGPASMMFAGPLGMPTALLSIKKLHKTYINKTLLLLTVIPLN